jgi:hypothetical protein
MTRRIDPIPDRIRGAGLIMVIPTMVIAAMPIGLLAGANFDRGIGLTFLGGSVAITTGMLAWLAPLAAATFVIGLLVYLGRFLREGLVVALGWMLGLVFVAPTWGILAGLVAYTIFTGRRRMTGAAIAPTAESAAVS